ncbi:MAG: glycosyltransferase family 39 protein [Planctomycetes bacterium]|nr:glycosyltransferase family 39 protein [Planctomycetota bacterium]
MGSKTAHVLCVLLTLATLVLRTTGLGFGLPVWEEPDPDIPGHVDLLREGWTTAAVEAPDEQYPHLIADLARCLPARPDASGASAPRTLEEHLRAASWTHLQVRWIVALLSSAAIPLTYVLARRFVRDAWALCACAFVATSLLHQSFAQQARPHGVATTLITLALVCDLALVRRPTWRAYAWAGVASALALASLHNALAVLLAGLAAHALRGGTARFLDRKLLLPLGLSLAAIPIFYPFLFEHVGQAREVTDGALRLAEHSVSLAQFRGRGLPVVAQVMWSYEPLLSLTTLLAALVWLVARGARVGDARERWIVLAFALPYLIAILLFERTYERFVLPLLPCAAVFSAWGFERLAQRVSGRLLAVLVAVALLVPGAACAKLAFLRTRPDTLDSVARFVSEDPALATRTVYLSAAPPALDLPLARRAEGLLFHGKPPKLPLTPWSAWQLLVPPERRPTAQFDLRWLTLPRGPGATADIGEHLASLAPALFVIEVYQTRTNHPLMVRLRRELQARGTRLARFGPDADVESSELELFFQLSDHYNDDEGVAWPNFTLRVLAARAIGPVVEVWELARP